MSPFSDYRLPPGRHGIPTEHVIASQRWRILGACAEVLRERGYGATTVLRVTKTAAVSKASFYRYFDGLPDCILAVYERTAESALGVLAAACKHSPVLDRAPAHAVEALLEFLQAEPALAYVLIDPALDDVPGVAAARSEFTGRCATLLTSAGERRGASENPQAQHLVGGLQRWLYDRLAAGGTIDRPAELARILAS